VAEIGTSIPVTIPTPSVTAGPLWAQEVSDFLTEVNDGFAAGVRSSVGLTVDAALPMGGFALTGCGGVYLDAIAAPTAQTQLLYALTGGELHYVDGNGDDVQITSGGQLNAAGISGINGDYGAGDPADVSYVAATSTFVFTQDPGVSAKIDVGDIRLRETTASALAVTLKSPGSLAVAYNVTFPAAVPASTSLVLMDSSGNLSLTRTPSITSLTLSGALTCANIIGSGLFLTTGDISGNAIAGNTVQTVEGNLRHGTKRIVLGAAGALLSVVPSSLSIAAHGGQIVHTGTNFIAYFDLVTPSVGTLTKVLFRVLSSAGTKPTLKLWSIAALTGAATQVSTTQTAVGTVEEDLSISGLTSTISSSFRYVLEVGINAVNQAVLTGYFEYTNP
jgi:hypothetical protein